MPGVSVQQFIERWSASRAAEHAVYAQFFLEFCDLLGVDKPDPGVDASDDYRFEKPVLIQHEDGNQTWQRIDFYRRSSFVIEAKQGSNPGDPIIGSARRGTASWDKMMRGAFAQAKKYATYLPGPRTPFLITCDIGHCFEVWTGFGGDYGDYGARQTIAFTDLADPRRIEFFQAVFTRPQSLDPSLHAARVTRQVATRLADLARALEKDGGDPRTTAQFLMRCIFTMFAEDVGLLPADLFKNAIRERWIPDPASFPGTVVQLWQAMDLGLPFGFAGRLLRFNGGLFAGLQPPRPLSAEQLGLLYEAAACDWASVEPAIFGTLVERALDPDERHQLGAHFTPREYIERLVRPAVIEPLRAEWQVAQTEARQILDKGDDEPTDADRKKAVKVLKDFHARLCRTRVLDPACGSGNFLYVTLDLFMELEAEVLRELRDLGEKQASLEVQGAMVNPGQFLGIEKNPRARQIADLVLWIGYLQRQRRMHQKWEPSEPILQPYKNILEGDALLSWRREDLRRDEHGKPVRVWDGKSTKKHPVTGLEVPDETGQATVTEYVDASPADWPAADFIVSNPPFVGCRMVRAALGDGYVDALWKAYPDVDRTADLVMYWWNKAALLARAGRLTRFGFITTNSITQSMNRGVVQAHLHAEQNPVAIAWAIPDHPWVDGGADVRIAMTVGVKADLLAASERPVLACIALEADEDTRTPGARHVEIASRAVARINGDLTGGADVSRTLPLKANLGLSFMGVTLIGKGFRLTRQEVRDLGYDPGNLPPVLRPHRNARELAQTPEDRFVIDLFGLTADEARARHPALYQWLLERVKPDRDQNKRDVYRRQWWVFGEPRPAMRAAVKGLARYILTPITAKHRFFVFTGPDLMPDCELQAVATDDAFVLGVLSSRFHVTFALAAGSRMGVGNDPRWRNTLCFDPFPFPAAADAQKVRIREAAEHLDALRKQVQAAHADVTLTGLYNALVRLRAAEAGGPPLTPKERAFHDRALVGTLKTWHDDLDAAVADAYGWPHDLSDELILERLVALNAERVDEESRGIVRWLRPGFQAAQVTVPKGRQQSLEGLAPDQPADATPKPWPKTTFEQIKAVRDLLAASPGTLSAQDVAGTFTGASLASVRRHLDALEALGFVLAHGEGKSRRWQAAT